MFLFVTSSEVLVEQACGFYCFSHVLVHRGRLSKGKRQGLTGSDIPDLTCFAGLGKISASVANKFLVAKDFSWIAMI